MMAQWSLGGYTFPVIPSDYRKPIVESGERYVRTSRGTLIQSKRFDDVRVLEAYILQWEAIPFGMYQKLREMFREGGHYVLTTDEGDTALVYFTTDGWQLEQRVDGSSVWYQGLVTLEVV